MKADLMDVFQQRPGDPLRIAVILPCFNEAEAIGTVVEDFRRALPKATIYVFDNGSTDLTRQRAEEAGAIVIVEYTRGKGHVVRRMFADVDADLYVMADGDGTYDTTAAPMLIAHLLNEHADMAIGARVPVQGAAFRRGHQFGNRLFNAAYRFLFDGTYSDIFSGYRVMTRRFVKSFPAISRGFEIETELSVHAGQLNIPVVEAGTAYRARGEGSASKLHTLRDGFRIAKSFFMLARETRPVLIYCSMAILLAFSGLFLALPIFQTYLETGLVPRLPTAVLATGLMLLAALQLTCGLILQSLTIARIEQKRILYLGLDGPPIDAAARQSAFAPRSDHQVDKAKPAMIQPDVNTKLVLRTMNSE